MVLNADDPDLQALTTRLAGGGRTAVLGGTMSRNVHLVDAGLVLRVHAPFVTPARVRAERRLKHILLDAGLEAARPCSITGKDLLRVAGRVAEVEQYVPHRASEPTWETYRSMFATISRIHGVLRDASVPRPVVSTYGPPGTLRRHLALLSRRPINSASRQRAQDVSAILRAALETWVPARELPVAVVHGDPRLENLPTGHTGAPVVLDLGFAARRPRIHDLAYAAAWILLGPDDADKTGSDVVEQVQRCITTYEEEAGALTPVERRAFDGYLVGVCLYQSTVAAHVQDPDAHLAQPGVHNMLEIARRTLARPRTFT